MAQRPDPATPRVTQKGRREFLRQSIAVTGGLALSALAPDFAWAAEHKPLGTWPAGVSGGNVFVGVTVPLTGPYSAAGEDEKRGYELIFDQLNRGELMGKISGIKGKGVLGKQVNYQIADSQTQPNPAVQAQSRFIQSNQAIMITGSLSSATAIALEKLAQREKVVNMVGASGSNDTTGKDCQRYGFRSQPSAYMAAKAMAPVVVKELGRNLKAAYLVPDYTYGHTVFDSSSEFLGKEGDWKMVSKQLVPLGTTDFSAALLNIANSGADVFVNVAFGADAVNSTKQAAQFGLLKKMKMLVPNISPFQAKELGADLMQGVYGTMDFWWTLEDHYPLAKHFVSTFEQRYQSKPRWCAHIAYLQALVWALAVEKAGTYYPVDVIKTLETLDLKGTTLGDVRYRAHDHQMIRPVPVVVGKKPSEMRNPEDFYRIAGVVAGDQVMSPPDYFGCKLGPYT
jgi:branched-chain amino acid transport system substrate-binding protein